MLPFLCSMEGQTTWAQMVDKSKCICPDKTPETFNDLYQKDVKSFTRLER